MKKKILLKGPLLTRSGYGEQARFALRALLTKEDILDIYILPLNWGQTGWIPEYTQEKAYIDRAIERTVGFMQQGGGFDISLQVTIPTEFDPSIAPYNVGYTAGIETTKAAPEWLIKNNEMDKVIVVSNHAKAVFENTQYRAKVDSGGHYTTGLPAESEKEVELNNEVPIEVINYPVKTYDNLNLDLSDLKHAHNFLCVAQMGPRKNMANTIKWFVEEFHDDEVGLVVKTNAVKNNLMDRNQCMHLIKNILAEYPKRNCTVHLLHGDMTDAEMHALYKHENINAFVCLSHGEGYGLPFFEAAYSGIPVVSVGWSGQCDFLYDEQQKAHFYEVSFDLQPVQPEVVWEKVIISESMWAYPREESAKKAMRTCYNEFKENTGIAHDAPEYAKQLAERFDEEKLLNQFANYIYNPSDEEKEWIEQLSAVNVL